MPEPTTTLLDRFRALGRKADALIAEHVMGYQWQPGPAFDAGGKVEGQGPILIPPGGIPKDYVYPPRGVIGPCWHVSAFWMKSRETASRVEDAAIGRCGGEKYLGALSATLGPHDLLGLARADAPTRCLACLIAVLGMEEAERLIGEGE